MNKWLIGAIGIVVGVIGTAAVGTLGSDGKYEVQIHSGSTNFVFPLLFLTEGGNSIVCKAGPEDLIAIELFRNGTRVRALKFCGTVEFKTDALKQVSYNIKK